VEARDVVQLVAGPICPASVLFVVAVFFGQTSLWPFSSGLDRAFQIRDVTATFQDKGYALATLLGYTTELHSQVDRALQGGENPSGSCDGARKHYGR
jgi:hypothetical protein